MGRKTREKQKVEALKEQRVVDRLAEKKSSGKTKRGVVRAHAHPVYGGGLMTGEMIQRRKHFLRKPRDWVYRGKSKRKDRQRTELVRYIFGKYPVPRFLEDVWNDMAAEREEKTQQRYRRVVWDGMRENKLSSNVRADWYIAVAQGQSLYKLHTRGILSKKETHLLLQAPDNYSCKQALWWAKAMAVEADVGIAHRLASSALTTRFGIDTILDEFWVSVMQFFVRNPIDIAELNNLFDFLIDEHRENANFKMKGRSLDSIRRKSEVWHRLQIKKSKIGGGSWEGLPIEDWKATTGKKDNRTIWLVHQIVTGNELVKEGQRMRHCVSSYKRPCMEGKTAIFTMTSCMGGWKEKRHVTIEVDMRHWRIIQIAGFANRRATGPEYSIIRHWAREHDIELAGYA